MAVDHSGGIFIFSFLLFFFFILSLFWGAFFNSGINSDNFATMQNLGATFHAHPDRSSVSDFQHRPPPPRHHAFFPRQGTGVLFIPVDALSLCPPPSYVPAAWSNGHPAPHSGKEISSLTSNRMSLMASQHLSVTGYLWSIYSASDTVLRAGDPLMIHYRVIS